MAGLDPEGDIREHWMQALGVGEGLVVERDRALDPPEWAGVGLVGDLQGEVEDGKMRWNSASECPVES